MLLRLAGLELLSREELLGQVYYTVVLTMPPCMFFFSFHSQRLVPDIGGRGWTVPIGDPDDHDDLEDEAFLTSHRQPPMILRG